MKINAELNSPPRLLLLVALWFTLLLGTAQASSHLLPNPSSPNRTKTAASRHKINRRNKFLDMCYRNEELENKPVLRVTPTAQLIGYAGYLPHGRVVHRECRIQ
jgi:hypothetical protein